MVVVSIVSSKFAVFRQTLLCRDLKSLHTLKGQAKLILILKTSMLRVVMSFHSTAILKAGAQANFS